MAGHLRTHPQFAKSIDVGRDVLAESNGVSIHSGTGSDERLSTMHVKRANRLPLPLGRARSPPPDLCLIVHGSP
ncbi:hypothetical protein BLA15945_00423 [Burkholderia lata]|uniref:Uncharacterized protein n=1 Tax=Burkholderia lata (strain ATCC 17760 / DSM 23089 / LMG 22485 / NCIMB 9086 / R18194 / 383) TaxID=482957 RepID=A0A6P2H5T4_BURL3|nr:hypothetical protein BLA15945_00423 [Burkholderia lata]